jgi:cytochrome c peroxidase
MRIGYIFIFLLSLNLFSGELIEPIPKTLQFDKQKALLGKKLFFDPILSSNKSISCASCHSPNKAYTDAKKVSSGVKGAKGRVNSPTILNSVFNFRQFWNGRAKDLIEQAKGPLHRKIEMNITPKEIEKRLSESEFYKNEFKKAYKDGKITYKRVLESIAEFEKTLITPDSKFDRYLKDEIKLSNEELQGYILFKKLGCITCHNGINIGGNSFQKMGIVFEYKNCIDDRYALTKVEFDKCVYKVPTLRNIALTAPYFHDGSASNLKDAVKKMSYHNLGFELNDKEAKSIVIFLNTLSSKEANLLNEAK